MKAQSIRRSLAIAAVTVVSGTGLALAHGPVVVLSNVGGQIVTNQLEVTPQNDSTNPADYPVGAPGRVFPQQYNVTNFNTFASSSYSANTPTQMQAIPVNYTSVAPLYNSSTATYTYDTTGNAGLYGQIELTDAVGNSTIDTGPGYAYGNGGFTAGTIFQIKFANALQWYNSSSGSFGATPDGEQLQAIRGSSFPNAGTGFANTLTSNNYQTGTGLQLTVSASQNGGSHSQLMYRLLESNGQAVDNAGQFETAPTSSEVADGLYLATFNIGTATTSPYQLQSSLPYYFLFEVDRNNDVTPSQVTPAVATADSLAASSVPEPASASLVALCGCGMLMRRRRTA